MKHSLLPAATTVLSAALSFTLISCDNPADKTTDAEVSEKKEVASNQAGAETYSFIGGATESSSIKFTGSKVTGSQSGFFKTFHGSFNVKDGTPINGSFTINMDSLTTDKDKLTNHLKNEDFFNVPKFPESTFEVTQFVKNTTGYDVSGNLTMVGVTKNITFPATIQQDGDTVTLTSKFDINRQTWGISYPDQKDELIRDELVLEFNLLAKKN